MMVAEGPSGSQAISRLPTAVTAFVGRTLRGPVDRPVALRGFGEFQQVFGGLWQPSPLSYAVEQFFENGGRRAVVVRVINGAAPSTLTLPCGGEALMLRALSPGSREALRASVDYDNIGTNEPECFNLVVQRVRALGSEHIEDQEIFRRLSVNPATSRFITTALQDSTLVRVQGEVPALRPDRTFRAGSRHPIGYVESNPDGDDGAPLTDYDLIGSPERRTGLFALAGTEGLHFLCIPPPSRDRDLGPSVLVVAEQFCRERQAMLIVDPPAEWTTCEEALHGLRELAFQSDHALMCFPRILAYDRLRGHYEPFANCGAVAGALARMDQQRPLWKAHLDDELLLRPGTRPARVLTEGERIRLSAHGVNALQSLRAARPQTLPLKTLAGGAGGSAESSLLTRQRRVLLVMQSIERGTRWVVFEAHDRGVGRKVTRQVQAFLQPLVNAGLFGGEVGEEPCYVICDERINSADDLLQGKVNLLVGIHSGRAGEYQSFMVTHSAEGSRVRPVRSRWLPEGTRLSVPKEETPRQASDATEPQRTLAQQLFERHREPRLQSATPVGGRTETASAGRRDLDLVADLHTDFGRGDQPL